VSRFPGCAALADKTKHSLVTNYVFLISARPFKGMIKILLEKMIIFTKSLKTHEEAN
jgi:hypothetical protein